MNKIVPVICLICYKFINDIEVSSEFEKDKIYSECDKCEKARKEKEK